MTTQNMNRGPSPREERQPLNLMGLPGQLAGPIDRSLDSIFENESLKTATAATLDWVMAGLLSHIAAYYVFGMDGIITRGVTVVLFPVMYRPGRQLVSLVMALLKRFVYKNSRKESIKEKVTATLEKIAARGGSNPTDTSVQKIG